MTPLELASMAQIALRARLPDGPYDRKDIAKAVEECAKLVGMSLGETDRETVIKELETRLVVKIGRATMLGDNAGHVAWYLGERKKDRRFFQRYTEYLKQEEGWPTTSIDGIDEATDVILEWLEDPTRDGPWDRRGLVVGDVQSGKTANYAALICKAADAGYKLIIVLAGMHKVLRKQTQQRLDRDFLGFNTASNKSGNGYEIIGVGKIDGSVHAEFATTQDIDGDFSSTRRFSFGMGVQQRPVILVVKKNASVLRNLNSWVSDVLAQLGDTETRPLLVIDDEADQASVDTGEQDFIDDIPDEDYEPKKINGQIRKLLLAFSRSAYVAYTATPFANILIHDAAQATEYGKDLFPAAFIVNLPTPSNYVGPGVVFGTGNEDGKGEDPLPVVRYVDQENEEWLAVDHKKDAVPHFGSAETIPPSLKTAILSFMLACAAKAARGNSTDHNSMLIHVSRFKDVQKEVFDQIEPWLSDVRRALVHKTGSEAIVASLEKLWRDDFVPTSAEIGRRKIGQGLPVTPWSAVKAELPDAVDKIRLQVVNSDLPDAIPYDLNRETGLSIIAIGGDKLSRGLTLEGLSVSYFLRASKMYDSLMQMGRWFGYRPGYVDLCRLFLTVDLELWFRHIAVAAEELRGRFDHMAMIGATPEQYGLRIQSHDILLVTAKNKMRHAQRYQVSFAGEGKIQTVFFGDRENNLTNAEAVVDFLSEIGAPAPDTRKEGRQSALRTWKKVGGTKVAAFIQSIRFPDEARDLNAELLASFIKEQLAVKGLTEWTVIVPSGDGEEIAFRKHVFKTVERSGIIRTKLTTRFVVKTILNPPDEALDLDPPELKRALDATNLKRAQKGLGPKSHPDGPEIRTVRGEKPERGLLLIYPLSPKAAKLEDMLEFPIFGIVVSFPDSKNARSVWYDFGTVAQRTAQ